MDSRVSPAGPKESLTFDITVPAGGWSVPAEGVVATDFTVVAGPTGNDYDTGGLRLTDCLAVQLPAGAAPALDVGLYLCGWHVAVAAGAATQGQVTMRFANFTAAPIVIAAGTVFHAVIFRH